MNHEPHQSSFGYLSHRHFNRHHLRRLLHPGLDRLLKDLGFDPLVRPTPEHRSDVARQDVEKSLFEADHARFCEFVAQGTTSVPFPQHVQMIVCRASQFGEECVEDSMAQLRRAMMFRRAL